jgi:hypothetical protein
MLKKFVLASSALFTIATVSTPAFAKDPPRLELSADDANRLDELDQDCRQQLKAQRPSMLKNVVLTVVRQAPFAFAGGFAGAAAGGFAPHGSTVTNLDYGLYNGAAVGVGSIGTGITGYESAKHYGQAGCMIEFLRKARMERPTLSNVVIIYNSFQANGHAALGANGKKLGKGDYFTLVYHPENPEDENYAPIPVEEPPPPPQ